MERLQVCVNFEILTLLLTCMPTLLALSVVHVEPKVLTEVSDPCSGDFWRLKPERFKLSSRSLETNIKKISYRFASFSSLTLSVAQGSRQN